jgi:O-succinylbenzoate synthase
MTSALESNVGLNAISQFTASLHPTLPQGLGTGQLYHNNIRRPSASKMVICIMKQGSSGKWLVHSGCA